MATYVMSDIHGEYRTLLKMLEKINFSDSDTLYILGDVVDRGPDGVKLLQFTRDRANVHLLLGNHEFMCLQFFRSPEDTAIRRRWNRNGNFTTLQGFDKVGEEEKEALLDYIDGLPAEAEVEVGGRKFLLVHGFVGTTREDMVWNRPKEEDKPDLPEGTILIIGHTPVAEYVCPGNEEDLYVYSRHLSEEGRHFSILHAGGFVDLDCCIGYGLSAARLSCLRLDDMAEFYQEVVND